jgi:hypothetical protein
LQKRFENDRKVPFSARIRRFTNPKSLPYLTQLPWGCLNARFTALRDNDFSTQNQKAKILEIFTEFFHGLSKSLSE